MERSEGLNYWKAVATIQTSIPWTDVTLNVILSADIFAQAAADAPCRPQSVGMAFSLRMSNAMTAIRSLGMAARPRASLRHHGCAPRLHAGFQSVSPTDVPVTLTQQHARARAILRQPEMEMVTATSSDRALASMALNLWLGKAVYQSAVTISSPVSRRVTRRVQDALISARFCLVGHVNTMRLLDHTVTVHAATE